ncbi:MAG TPA: hypothetical protein VGM56_04695 [Byssovorax sp.]
MSDELAERFEELAEHVLGPLVLGGELHLTRPFGATLALKFAKGRELANLELRLALDVARVRRARLLAPVDTVKPVDASSFALVAALNDLLQATNHELAGPLTRGRHRRLVANVVAVCERVPPPRDVGSALARHATFARTLDVVRTDSTVAWWTGSARFRGQPAPPRLLAWPSLRQVTVDSRKVTLGSMAAGIGALSADEFEAALALWLTRSPLTDIATATRATPQFAWSASTLALIAVAPGRSLAYRAMARQPGPAAMAVLARAAKGIPDARAAARRLVESFASEVSAGFKLAEGRPAQRA